MDKCRICLSSQRKLESIFDSNNGNSFASMMMSVANIKIVKKEEITEGICEMCAEKLIEAYNIKVQIERADEVLQNSAGFKKIYFTNLKDKIEIDTTPEFPQQSYDDITDSFKDGKSSLVFKNITIQKIEGDKNESEPLPAVDFLYSLKAEDDSSYNNGDEDDFYQCDNDYPPQSDDEDPDYSLPLSMRKTKRNTRKQTKLDEGSQSGYEDFDLPLTKRKTEAKKWKQKKQNENSQSDDEDPDYRPLSMKKPKGERKIAKKGVERKGNEDGKKVLIKPVILKNVRVLRTEIQRTTKSNKQKYDKNKMYMCNCCGKMIKSIKSHLLTHTGVKSHKCDICSKTFITKSGLYNHNTTHHGVVEKSFKCDQCVAAFATARALQSHYVMHLDVNKFVCDVCSKSFKRRNALSRHKMIHNVTNRCIKCDFCTMTFISKDHLKHHLRIHTGERPFKCEICSQPYSYKRDFNRHCYNKHGVFLKRRSVNVMNEEVLKRERALMRDLTLKMQGITREGKPPNPFEGPQAAMAFEQAIQALRSNKIPLD